MRCCRQSFLIRYCSPNTPYTRQGGSANDTVSADREKVPVVISSATMKDSSPVKIVPQLHPGFHEPGWKDDAEVQIAEHVPSSAATQQPKYGRITCVGLESTRRRYHLQTWRFERVLLRAKLR